MTKKKRGRKPIEGGFHKYSILIPVELHQKLQDITLKKDVSLSDIVRHFLEQGVLRELERRGEDPHVVSVSLDDSLLKLLEETGKYLRVNHLESLIIFCLTQYLPDMFSKAKVSYRELEKILNEDGKTRPEDG